MNNSKIDNYVLDCIASGKQYAEDVISGKITANKYIKLAATRYKKDLENKAYVHRWDKVRRFFKFCFFVNVKHNNKYQRFTPLPFQAFAAINLFLFYNANDEEKRRFRYYFLFVSRKNGKSVWASVISLYLLIGDGEIDPASIVVASTREQAGILLDYAKSITLNSPILQKKLEIMQFAIRYHNGNSRGIFKVLANNANRLDGYNQNCAVLDEIHSYTDDSLYKVIKSAILARKNPLTVLISTAGFNQDSFCNDMVEMCKNILTGNLIDESYFAQLYTLDDDDDFNDSDNWIKSVPALNEIIHLEDMQVEFNQAKNMKSLLNNFLTKNLNVFTTSIDDWIDDEYLNSAFNTDINLEELKGRECFVGVDLASTRDLVSIVYLFYLENEDRFVAIPKFFLANNPIKKLRKGGINLQVWIDKGFITECDTKTIDYDLIYNHILEMNEIYNIRSVQYDKFNSALLITRLEEAGVFCESFAQTAMQFNFPLKYIEKYLYEKNINLGANEVLKWNFRNVVLYMDGNGNIKIVKNKAKDSVDGVVSLGMAMGGWIKANIDSEMIGLSNYVNQN